MPISRNAKEREAKAAELQSLLAKFIATMDRIAYPDAAVDLADIEITTDGKIQIDPSWTRRGGTFLVENIITKSEILGLKEGEAFTAQRNAVRSDKFIVEPENFDKWINVVKNKLGQLQENGYIQAEQVQPHIAPLISAASSVSSAVAPHIADQSSPKLDAKEMEAKATELQSLLAKFIATMDRIAYPDAVVDLADVKITTDGKIQIDPSWSRRGGTFLVESIITKPEILGFKEGQDFDAQRHAVRSDKFIIEPENFDTWINTINQKLGKLQERGYVHAEQAQAHVAPPIASVSPSPISKPPYIADRTRALSDNDVKKIQIPQWEVQKETLNSSVTRFVQSANKDTYVDVDKKKHQISSNSTSVDAFEGMVKAFQSLYGKANLPTITLSGSANNEQSRENCKAVLESSGYDASQVKKIMSPLLATPALLAAAAPEADQSSGHEASSPRPSRGNKP